MERVKGLVYVYHTYDSGLFPRHNAFQKKNYVSHPILLASEIWTCIVSGKIRLVS